jgi:hypothetical protein
MNDTTSLIDGCGCRKCLEGVKDLLTGIPVTAMRFVVCGDCGNKRCPRASDHRNECTKSNAPGQQGSVYA